MQSLYYNPMKDENLRIIEREPNKEITYMSMRISIALSMNFLLNTAGIRLTLIDYAGRTIEARGSHADCSTRKQLEEKGADAAFQWATELSGYNIIFQSDSSPTLQLLMGRYTNARQNRYNVSENFEIEPSTCINFKVTAFLLITRYNIVKAANIATFVTDMVYKTHGKMRD